jgi:glycosyltransferase involved in cell wall biosynthesis
VTAQRSAIRVLQVMYQDPVTYPPVLNAAAVIAEAGGAVLCLGFRRSGAEGPELPRCVSTKYIDAPSMVPEALRGAANLASLRLNTARAVKAFRPHAVIAYDWWGGWAVLPMMRRRNFMVALHMLDLLNEGRSRLSSSDDWIWAAVRERIDRFDTIVAPERQRAEYLRDAWHIQSEVLLCANSPRRSAPARNQTLRRILAERSGATLSRLAIVLGNMGMYDELIEGVAKAKAPWDVAIVGCGHRPSVERIRRRSLELGIAKRVHIFEYTPYATVQEWLRSCDLGIALYPSDSPNVNWRTMGNASVKVQEYMAAGLPSLVCSRHTFEALGRETGALEVLDEETPASIAAALDRLEPGSERHSILATNAYRAHAERYNTEDQIRPFLERIAPGLFQTARTDSK